MEYEKLEYEAPQAVELDCFAWDLPATYYRLMREQDERAEQLRQEILSKKRGKAAA